MGVLNKLVSPRELTRLYMVIFFYFSLERCNSSDKSVVYWEIYNDNLMDTDMKIGVPPFIRSPKFVK